MFAQFTWHKIGNNLSGSFNNRWDNTIFNRYRHAYIVYYIYIHTYDAHVYIYLYILKTTKFNHQFKSPGSPGRVVSICIILTLMRKLGKTFLLFTHCLGNTLIPFCTVAFYHHERTQSNFVILLSLDMMMAFILNTYYIIYTIAIVTRLMDLKYSLFFFALLSSSSLSYRTVLQRVHVKRANETMIVATVIDRWILFNITNCLSDPLLLLLFHLNAICTQSQRHWMNEPINQHTPNNSVCA